MKKTFIVSDTHFGHDKDFIYGARGFDNVTQHDNAIIKNWNEIISVDDEVYHLGDVMLGPYNYGISCLERLNGNIHIIRGNHDTETRMDLYEKSWNVVEVTEGKFLRYGKYHFYLCHYPVFCSNFDIDKPLKHRMINLCGHTHTTDPFCDFDKALIFHCELDGHNMTPWNIDEIIFAIKQKLDS